MAVVNGAVFCINPQEPPRAQIYVLNNIFFSWAVDSRDLYKVLFATAEIGASE
jgi:hypothetical protein